MGYDLTIRGAGIFGLSIAWEATRRGAKVRIIDPNGPGAGASGGIVGALQPHTPDNWNAKKQYQLESLLLARSFWPEVEQTSNLSSGYAPIGRLQPILADRSVALANARTDAAKTTWGDAATWQVIPTDQAGPWHAPSPTGLHIHDTLSAILHPRRAIESLAKALTAKGVEIVTDAPDQGATLWATGWQGLRDLSAELDQDMGNGVKGQAALLQHDAAGQAQLFADGLHIIPHTDGTTAIGSTSERDFTDATSTDAQLDTLIERAKTLMPVLKDAPILTRWAGVRPRAISRAPLLGPHPKTKDHYIANGGFKIGFGMAPKVAQTMCDLILEKRDTILDDFHT